MGLKNYFSYNRLKHKADACGRKYSWKKHFLAFGLMCLVTALTGWLYGLKPMWLILVLAGGCISVPAILAAVFVERENSQRFNDVDLYLHQMIYSFQRQPKIMIALEDTYKIAGGKLQSKIKEAMHAMEYGTTRQVYREALEIIEKEYPCARITTLHHFLIHVEEKGGRYENALKILLADADNWVKRVYKFQDEMKHVKQTSTVGVVLSFVMASVSVLVSWILKSTSEIHIDITGEVVYQMVSSAFLIFCIAYYTYMQTRYNCDWLVKQRSDKMIEKDYHMAFDTDISSLRKTSAPVYAVLLIACCILLYMKKFIWVIALTAVILLLLFMPYLNKTGALNRVRRDLYYDFADWLRDVALNLSEESLQMSIEDTYDTCPLLMKKSLEQFIYAIEENPSDVTPYYEFLSEFQVLDISSSVRILYSLTENDDESADKTLQTLILRNYELMEQYETANNKDTISVMQFAEYIPTFFVSVKVAADMLLIISNYL